MFRIGAAVVLPIFLLAIVELGLRLAGYGYDPGFFRRTIINSEDSWVQNDQFGLSFFPPRAARFPGCIIMKARKDPGTQRIFVLGESAAMGDPAPRFGASRYLEALLRERFPAGKFELINTGLTAINSHAILPIARECAKREGDIWVVYMGNNEMIGPYGAATVFGPKAPPLPFVRFTLAVKRTRTGQALMALGSKLKGSANETAWGGMKMFLENTVPPGDPDREVVYRSFARNLTDILRAATSSGARVVVSSVAVNKRNCSPFASLSTGSETKSLETLRQQITNGAPLEILNQCEARLNAMLDRAPYSAESHFLLAQVLLQEGRTSEASKEYELALEFDALPFRADARINSLIKDTTRDFGKEQVSYCDAASALRSGSSVGIPGEESFYEHVHLNFDGNYRLAVTWANEVANMLPRDVKAGATEAWAEQALCERRLALTDWNRKWVIEEVLRRFEQPPLSGQLVKSQQISKLQNELTRLSENIKILNPSDARQLYEEAIALAPRDFQLYENFADFLEAVGDSAGALDQRRMVCDLIPHYYFAHFSLGTLLKEQRQFEAAQASLKRAASINPTQPDIRLHLGAVYALQKDWKRALAEFNLGRKLDPTEPRFWHMAGDVLWKIDRRKESIEALRSAVSLAPGYVEARERLAEALGISGDFGGAIHELERVLEFKPSYERARINLGVALLKQGKAREALQQFDLALAANPGNALVQGFRQEALAQSHRMGLP